MSNISSNDHFIAGGFSGIATRAVVAPLDVLKIRFQLQAHTKQYKSIPGALLRIFREEGITALWKGNLIATAMSSPYTAITFTTQKYLKQHVFHNQNDSITNAVCGGLGGMLATTLTYPLDLLRSRFIAQKSQTGYTSILDACRTIYRSKGVAGAFEGISPALLGVFPYMGVQFAVYEVIKSFLLHHMSTVDEFGANATAKLLQITEHVPVLEKNKQRIAGWLGLSYWFDQLHQDSHHELPIASNQSDKTSPQLTPLWVSPIAGLASGMSGKFISFPFDLIKRRMQMHSFSHTFDQTARPSQQSIAKVATNVFRNEGFLAFYKGITPSLIKSGCAASLSFFFYEAALRVLVSYRSLKELKENPVI